MKPEIRRSLTVAEWKREVRLTWIYLWMYLDDDGRGLDDMRLIVAELYPLDRDVTEKKMDGWLATIAGTKSADDDVPPLCRYEVQGRRYLHATGWSHQKINRPQPSRIPPCPTHESFSESDSERLTELSSDPARSDSPPSRAPADQGSGSKGSGSMNAAVAARSRPPDELWDAVIDVCGIDTASITASGRGSINSALKQLRDVEATPGQITVRANRYRQRYPNTSLTPAALAKHWASLSESTQRPSTNAAEDRFAAFSPASPRGQR